MLDPRLGHACPPTSQVNGGCTRSAPPAAHCPCTRTAASTSSTFAARLHARRLLRHGRSLANEAGIIISKKVPPCSLLDALDAQMHGCRMQTDAAGGTRSVAAPSHGRVMPQAHARAQPAAGGHTCFTRPHHARSRCASCPCYPTVLYTRAQQCVKSHGVLPWSYIQCHTILCLKCVAFHRRSMACCQSTA